MKGDLCESDSEDEDEDSSFESVVLDFSTEDIPKHGKYVFAHDLKLVHGQRCVEKMSPHFKNRHCEGSKVSQICHEICENH